eukprot:11071342-Lingulodinium_polyedra.AAC.1
MECARRAICEQLRRRMVDLTASLCNVCGTLHNYAVAIALRRRNGSLIARSRTPRARQFSGARMERANVRLTSRCGGGRSIRPHRCA